MQCPSCQFENMPGSCNCARCGASLNLATAEIDVHPPRASALERRVPARLVASFRRVWQAVMNAFTRVMGIKRPTINFGESRADYLSLLIPGLHQLRHGNTTRGLTFLGGFVALTLLSFLLAGIGPGSACLGLLFAWHVVATVDASVAEFGSMGDRVRFTAFIAICLLLLPYVPGLMLLGRVATPVYIGMTTGHLTAGDVVWYNRSATPQVGDLVLYDTGSYGIRVRNPTLYNQVYQVAGQRINRLVAREGQTVAMEDGKLMVDGSISPWQPRRALALPKDGLKVRPGYVFILPEDLMPGQPLQLRTELVERLGMIKLSNIYGPLIGRTFPPTRARLF